VLYFKNLRSPNFNLPKANFFLPLALITALPPKPNRHVHRRRTSTFVAIAPPHSPPLHRHARRRRTASLAAIAPSRSPPSHRHVHRHRTIICSVVQPPHSVAFTPLLTGFENGEHPPSVPCLKSSAVSKSTDCVCTFQDNYWTESLYCTVFDGIVSSDTTSVPFINAIQTYTQHAVEAEPRLRLCRTRE
nr:hypothetical protein [Tanacetum cinerariifolium]